MQKKDAETLNIRPEEQWRYVHLDDAKGNMSPLAQYARWFQRKGVPLPNGQGGLDFNQDEVGVLEIWAPPDVDWSINAHQTKTVLDEVEKRWAENWPFSVAPQSNRYLGEYIMAECGFNKPYTKSIIKDWLANGIIASLPYDQRNKTQGLKVQKRS